MLGLKSEDLEIQIQVSSVGLLQHEKDLGLNTQETWVCVPGTWVIVLWTKVLKVNDLGLNPQETWVCVQGPGYVCLGPRTQR